jgi:hypothetical protein
MEYGIHLVIIKQPSPPAAARFYAYISSVYHDVLVKTDSQYQASLATAEIIDIFYPDSSVSTFETLEHLNLKGDGQLTPDSRKILNIYKNRLSEDFSRQKIVVKEPVGVEYWVGENPSEPSAGFWQRWFVKDTDFNIPPPPIYKSKEYENALAIVKSQASINFTEKQKEAIDFWAGSPGTESPAGIWQNRLFSVTSKYSLSDKEYSYAQMILAQSLADAFMECWKVKYTYWTKRPSMSDKSITFIWLNNPNFPSYVSGHATVSFTAATILSTLFPEYKESWFLNAEEAKNTRLWAGIHFPYDLEEGKRLGEEIGKVYVKFGLKVFK